MPSSPRAQRHQAILELLQRQPVRSQAELLERLAERGLAVNQGSLSRDLRDLGVRKGPAGYELSEGRVSPAAAAGELAPAIAAWLLAALPAQNQVVLKTPPGGAQPLALALDRAELDELLGTIAGDDTVLAICGTPRDARALVARLEGMAIHGGAA